jgi:glycosyltransferase involved in cell wall biosynthesis
VSTLATGTSDILVVLPTLGDRPEKLQRALSSVDAQRPDVSVRVVVVIPEDKKDALPDALADRVEIVTDPHRGMSAAINAGLSARAGEQFYIWLGDDDYYQQGGLATLHNMLRADDRAVVAYGGCDYIDDDGQLLWTSRAGSLASLMIGKGPNLVPHPAALMRLDALEQVGGYDESLSLAMDLDVLLKLKKRGRFVHTTRVVSAFGWHPDSLTVQDRTQSEREARMVKRRHLPAVLRGIEPLWEYPVAWASRLAAHTLNRKRKQG